MTLFDRIRRRRTDHVAQFESRTVDLGGAATEPVDEMSHAGELLPRINQRVTISSGPQVPVPSRVEDIGDGRVQIAFPSMQLEFGDEVVLNWEHDDAWYSLETRVLGLDQQASVPVVHLASSGHLTRYDDRRTDVRRSIELPIELRVVRARGVRSGHELRTRTVELSANAIRFVTSAPFAPGDLVEARLIVGEGLGDVITARLRVIRIDVQPEEFHTTCSATFDEILRSDRARIIALADTVGNLRPPTRATPPTLDGVGGRDAPIDLGNLQSVVEWLRRDER